MQKIRRIATASVVATAAALCIGAGTAQAATPATLHPALVASQGTAGSTAGATGGSTSTGGVGDLLGGLGSLLGSVLGLLGL
ncbi:MAG TPA: hypothetical protein VGH89_21080 [Pseudonocardia sp.]|jgi:hypothetical protein